MMINKDNRISELEMHLERVLDLFDETLSGYEISVDTRPLIPADNEYLLELPVSNFTAQVIEEAIEVLYGNEDQADGSY
jgi:hypothetical protein